jgi:hypothetical protein
MRTQDDRHRPDREALARECAKLDPAEEKAMAEEGMAAELADWPPYDDTIDTRPKASVITRVLNWVQIGGLIAVTVGLLLFCRRPLRLLHPPSSSQWIGVFSVVTGVGAWMLAGLVQLAFMLASVVRVLMRLFRRTSRD